MAGIRLLALGALLAGCLPEPPAPGFWRTGADAAPGDAVVGDDGLPCQPAAEICNEIDDDCDGRADEDFDLTSTAHCGACGNDCTALPGVEAASCEGGVQDRRGRLPPGSARLRRGRQQRLRGDLRQRPGRAARDRAAHL
ncbi:MAG: hypothetical protein R3F60_02180 [bacterium]